MENKFVLYISRDKILKRVSEMAKEISGRIKALNEEVYIVWIAEGAIMFASDLIRAIDADIRVESLKVSSYGDSLQSNGAPKVRGDLSHLNGKRVLIVDDIIDTGETAKAICSILKDIGAKDIKTCFLLDKKINKEKAVKPDFVGFEIEDVYVFGYGLDILLKYRNLPDIYSLEQ